MKIRYIKEIGPKRFHKYLKMFERKERERMPIRKTQDYIDFREEFILNLF